MFDLVLENQSLQVFIVMFIGLMLGSFCTAIVYRERVGQSWIWNKAQSENEARSFCPSCLHVLGILDLIPVFSWLWQRGRCRYCQIEIPLRYILTELFLMGLCLAFWVLFGFSMNTLILMVISPFATAQILLLFGERKISYLLCGVVFMGMIALFF